MKVNRILASALLLMLPLACGGDSGGTEEAQTSTPAAEAPAVVVDMDLPEGVTAEMVTAGQAVFTGEQIGISNDLLENRRFILPGREPERYRLFTHIWIGIGEHLVIHTASDDGATQLACGVKVNWRVSQVV